MAESKDAYLKVVELAFAKPEFDFLMARGDFMAALSKCGSAEDIERICIMGQWLLDASPEFNILKRTKQKSEGKNSLNRC